MAHGDRLFACIPVGHRVVGEKREHRVIEAQRALVGGDADQVVMMLLVTTPPRAPFCRRGIEGGIRQHLAVADDEQTVDVDAAHASSTALSASLVERMPRPRRGAAPIARGQEAAAGSNTRGPPVGRRCRTRQAGR